MNVRNCHIITLPNVNSPDGCSLTFGEDKASIPFEIKRFYYIYNFHKSGIDRGSHAHKVFKQIFFALRGSFLMKLDDGNIKESYVVQKPFEGVYVGPGVWHEMLNISEGAVIFAVCSHHYDEKDYLRDYKEFIDYFKI